MFEKFALY